LTHLKVDPHQAYPEAYNPDKKQDQPRYFTAPIAVFQLTEDRQELEVLAIQLDRQPNATVYSPTTTDPNVWLFAKATVKTADAQMHQVRAQTVQAKATCSHCLTHPIVMTSHEKVGVSSRKNSSYHGAAHYCHSQYVEEKGSPVVYFFQTYHSRYLIS
jgi:hypothetical protein